MIHVENIINKVIEGNRNALYEHEAKDLLSLVGLPTTSARVMCVQYGLIYSNILPLRDWFAAQILIPDRS